MNKSETIVELAKALSKFQGEVKQPTKDGKNPHFKSNYVTIDGVVEAITETASKNGLSFMQFPINRDGRIGVYTMVMHESGEWIESEPIFINKLQKDDAQGIGSALTYLRRYSLAAVFGIASDVDDDGNNASQQSPQQQQYQPQQQQYNAPPQNNAQQEPQQTNSNLITEGQVKLVGVKTSQVVAKTGQDKADIGEYVKVQLGLSPEVSVKELTKQQASKMIELLTKMAEG